MFSDLQTAIENVKAQLDWIEQELAPIMGNLEQLELNHATDLYMLLKLLKEHATDLAKQANIAMPETAAHVRKIFEALDIGSMDKNFGDAIYRMAPDLKMRISVSAENKGAFIAWMKQHDRGKEYIKEDIHHASLESFVVKEMNDGHEAPPFVQAYPEAILTVRKLPGKKSA